MISTRWLEKRKPHWTRLEGLLDAVQAKGLRSLTRADLRHLSLLYRQAASDLATIREDPTSVQFARYLNQLLARAHNTIYSGQQGNSWALLTFFRRTWPAAFRRNAWAFGVALALFAVAAVAGAALTWQQPDFKLRVLGPQMVDTIERRQMWTHSILSVKPAASSQIMTNNLSVSFMVFAMGITAGIGTIYMIVLNGVMIGVIGMACWQSGMSVPLWSFVAPHGVLELPAIFIASGAGLRVAQGLLFPGVLPRRESLSRGGSEAVQLLLGAVPMLIVAGIIEAFVSPTQLDPMMKFAMAGAIFTMLLAYLFSGRGAETNTRHD